ncbi:Cof-type HAD-IIB family hydrolase [Vagococcus intermedius]|uniref:Cof-type HAD-IIB family hydrolase n=1 Tax=Vagococcus intermedius TaxID=2991418 RepID=A0AAF0I6I9_9ENTE|nr:Cof-type HAD-IIB family hydrolase [Vagococcus intermedius]WEG72705.1 Cof-type HAD-IIB family hydrolase [Vagococcus intermedius]WEG74790.1 Cof-type HAD-IIB family hydrolase [Vagococcus intermedius]
MYKAIVSDIDETLITEDGIISPANLAAINKAQDLGIHFIPATGRSFNDFQHILKATDIHNKKETYSISYNGGVTTENFENTILDQTNLTFEQALQIFNLGVAEDVLIHVFTLTDIFTYRMNDNEKGFLDDHVVINVMETPSIEHLRDDAILKINFQHADMTCLQAIEDSLPIELKNSLDINYSSHRYIEFNPHGINKGNALAKLLKRLAIQPEEVLAIGDNMNDRTMVALAGTGVAVANAVPELKEQANYICKNDHNNSAVSEAINKFILNK